MSIDSLKYFTVLVTVQKKCADLRELLPVILVTGNSFSISIKHVISDDKSVNTARSAEMRQATHGGLAV